MVEMSLPLTGDSLFFENGVECRTVDLDDNECVEVFTHTLKEDYITLGRKTLNVLKEVRETMHKYDAKFIEGVMDDIETDIGVMDAMATVMDYYGIEEPIVDDGDSDEESFDEDYMMF